MVILQHSSFQLWKHNWVCLLHAWSAATFSSFSSTGSVFSSEITVSIMCTIRALMLWFYCGHVFFELYSWWNEQYWSMPILSTFNTTFELCRLDQLVFVAARVSIPSQNIELRRLVGYGGVTWFCFNSSNSLDRYLVVGVNLSILVSCLSLAMTTEA